MHATLKIKSFDSFTLIFVHSISTHFSSYISSFPITSCIISHFSLFSSFLSLDVSEI